MATALLPAVDRRSIQVLRRRYYVETYRTTSGHGPHAREHTAMRVHRASLFNDQRLHPNMTAVFEVDGARSQNEAMAVVAEWAALGAERSGHNVRVIRAQLPRL